MSREFGDGHNGYFHNKISQALEDARSGRTSGAKLMAKLLAPMADIAYAVSSEEAGDSDESYVVSEFFNCFSALRSAVNEIEAYLQPAKDLTVKMTAAILKPNAVISKVKSSNTTWSVVINMDKSILNIAQREVLDEAVISILEDHVKNHRFQITSISYGYNTSTQYYAEVVDSNAKHWWINRVKELETELSLLKTLKNTEDPENER